MKVAYGACLKLFESFLYTHVSTYFSTGNLWGKKLDGLWVHSRSCELLPWIAATWRRQKIQRLHPGFSSACGFSVQVVSMAPPQHPLLYVQLDVGFMFSPRGTNLVGDLKNFGMQLPTWRRIRASLLEGEDLVLHASSPRSMSCAIVASQP